jgi:hypothetical protein
VRKAPYFIDTREIDFLRGAWPYRSGDRLRHRMQIFHLDDRRKRSARRTRSRFYHPERTVSIQVRCRLHRWRGLDSNFPFRARSPEMGTFSLPIDI